MSEANKAIVRRSVEEIWNKGNLTAMEEFYSNAINHVDPLLPETRGIEAVKKVAAMAHTAWPDIRYTIDDLIAEGDKVVMRWTVRGTHKGELLGIPATGKQFEATGTTTNRLAGGKIVESWVSWDALGMLKQLGAVSLPK
jgi:steroid delta-isomerase-like uncharacterized protein